VNEADPRVKRTRKLLVDAFMELLSEKTFQAISVQDIAERATLNRATFYAHFEDKYALMDYMVRNAFREALQGRVAATAPFTLDNLHRLVVTVCEYLAQFYGHCAPASRDLNRVVVEATVQEELYAFLLAWLAQAAPVTASAKAQREAAAAVMSWAIFGAGLQWSRGERTRSAEDWARQVMAVLVGGVSKAVSVPAQAVYTGADGTGTARIDGRA
jgi:AcrR family transcriptional regulator